MNRVGLGIGLLAAAVGGAAAGASSPDPRSLAIPAAELDRARVLVRALGSDAYRDRERAERELAGMGRLARPALAEAAGTDPSPEVRVRAGRLLPGAEAADLQARVDTFLADAEGKYEHDLPGMALFRQHVGTGRAARELYAEAAKGRANLELLAALDRPPAEAGKAVADRRLGLYLAQNPQQFNGNVRINGLPPKVQQPTLADVTTLLVAEVVVPSADIPKAGPFQQLSAAHFLNGPAAADAIGKPDVTPHAAPFRAALAGWLNTRTAPADLENMGWLAQTLKAVPETTGLLRRTVTTPGVPGWSKGQAVGLLVQRRKRDERPFLRTLLKDETPVTVVWLGANDKGQPLQAACQVRDLALAVLLLQDGRDLREWGFDIQPNAAVSLSTVQNGGIAFGFVTDEKRAAALDRWAAEDATIPPPRPVERK